MRLPSRLLVFDYVSSLLDGEDGHRPDIGRELRNGAKKVEFGRRGDGQSNYFSMFDSWGSRVKIDRSQLAEYDMNVLGIEDRLGRYRSGFRFTYFQYLAALYSEIYLHRMAGDPSGLLRDLRDHRTKHFAGDLSPVSPADIRKAAFWMATGSGKTLLAHANIMQFERYQPFTPDNILFVTPSPSLSGQHLDELAQSGIAARHALSAGRPGDVQVLEITKLYVDRRDSKMIRRGESLPTSTYDGQNLLLVDEGHKGSTTKSDEAEERKWRDIRESLAGNRGFTFEYSATFAQITETNDELLDEYGKTILFDYGYKHFWEDGYGKDYRVVNVRKEGAYDTDELLLAGLLVLYEQVRYRADHRTEVIAYNVEPPLMVFIGATVTGAVDSEVRQIVEFLDRVLSEPDWTIDRISGLLAGTTALPAELFSHRFPYLGEVAQSADATYADLCSRLFHGTGRLVMHMLQRADGEIGLRTADALQDAYCGVVNVGNASGFAKKAEDAGIARGEDDHITESIFDAIDTPESKVSFLIGSKKFSEGWSSWRVSVMGLLKVGKSAGPQVIQLFGRGVRLKGREMQLRRSSHLLGTHPKHLHLLETIHIFGLKADYMEAFNEAVRREGVPPPATRLLPITVRDDLPGLDLRAPDRGTYDFFTQDVVTFTPDELDEPIRIDLLPQFTTAEGIAKHVMSPGAEAGEEGALPLELLDQEALYLELLDFKRRRGWYNTYITRTAVADFLREKVSVAAPEAFFAVTDERTHSLAQSAGRDALHKGLERFVYTAQRRRETSRLTARPVDASHPNFPTVRTEYGEVPAYRLEVPEDLVRELDRLLARIASGDATMEDTAEPLPRLHLDSHLYAPLLLRETNVDKDGTALLTFRDSLVRSTPTGLVASEIELARDLRDLWHTLSDDPAWVGYSIYLLRNLSKKGIGFFETVGFYPDFLLWLKKNDHQALAFIDPHGLAYGDPHNKVGALKHIRLTGLADLPMTAWIVTPTILSEIGSWGQIRPSVAWLQANHILLQSTDGYLLEILEELKLSVDAVAGGQYMAGDAAPAVRQADVVILADAGVREEEQFKDYLPLYDLKAAAGYFGSAEPVEREGWVRVEGHLSSNMFVARAVGRSMEPTIQDGDLCVFRRYRGGTRQDLVVLVQWVGPEDPETGGSYAVKRYHRVGERGSDELRIELRPTNPEFDPIVLTPEYEDEVAVIGEFIQVLQPPKH